jgi:hypothetical protein
MFKQEQAKLSQPIDKPMYRFDCDPSRMHCTNIRAQCIYCAARVYYKLENGVFQITMLKN